MNEKQTNNKPVPVLKRWWQHLFPAMPDFQDRLCQQCDLAVAATAALLEFMRTAEDLHADKVIELERQGDALRAANMTSLHQAFATPFDREDIYRSIANLDEILNYAKTTIREMRGLGIGPDEHTCAMAEMLHEGTLALQRGYSRLEEKPLLAEADADAARKTERATEKRYREALSQLFDAQHYVNSLTPEQEETASSLEILMQELTKREITAVGSAVGFVVEILKRREVYRHMSNAADRVANTGQVLHDIVAKIA